MLYIAGGVVARVAGVYIGLGWPGLPFGKEDRVLPRGMRRRRKDHFTPLDLLRQKESRRR